MYELLNSAISTISKMYFLISERLLDTIKFRHNTLTDVYVCTAVNQIITKYL